MSDLPQPNSFLDKMADIKLHFAGQLALAVVIFIIVLYIFSFIFNYTKRFIKSYKGTVTIVDGLKNAEKLNTISNNPTDKSYLEIPRSYNEENGVEFTYMGWILIDKWSIRNGKYKHIFHKGNKIVNDTGNDTGNGDFNIPLLNAPGCYFNKSKNELFVIMNTYDKPGNQSIPSDGNFKDDDVLVMDNIPINKWFLLTIILEGQTLKVFNNGYLQKSKQLKSYPRQNNSPIYINDMDGFSGFLSNFKYYNYAVPQSEIQSYVNDGPGTSACLKNKDVPKYMSNTNTYVETNI